MKPRHSAPRRSPQQHPRDAATATVFVPTLSSGASGEALFIYAQCHANCDFTAAGSVTVRLKVDDATWWPRVHWRLTGVVTPRRLMLLGGRGSMTCPSRRRHRTSRAWTITEGRVQGARVFKRVGLVVYEHRDGQGKGAARRHRTALLKARDRLSDGEACIEGDFKVHHRQARCRTRAGGHRAGLPTTPCAPCGHPRPTVCGPCGAMNPVWWEAMPPAQRDPWRDYRQALLALPSPVTTDPFNPAWPRGPREACSATTRLSSCRPAFFSSFPHTASAFSGEPCR